MAKSAVALAKAGLERHKLYGRNNPAPNAVRGLTDKT